MTAVPAWVPEALMLRAQGMSYAAIGEVVDRSPKSVWRVAHTLRGVDPASLAPRAPRRAAPAVAPLAPPQVPLASVLANVCAYYGLSAAQLRAHDRTLPVCGARQEAIAACVLAGHSVAAAGRFLYRDHSTVSHTIDVVLADPERTARVRCFAGSGTVDDLPAFAARYVRASASDLTAMLAYVSTALLGTRHVPGHVCAYGLMLLANPAYHAGMTRALAACGSAEQAPRISAHLRSLGYARRAA